MLRWLFVFADDDKSGFISHEEFIKLLNVLHPYDKGSELTALRNMNMHRSKLLCMFSGLQYNLLQYAWRFYIYLVCPLMIVMIAISIVTIEVVVVVVLVIAIDSIHTYLC